MAVNFSSSNAVQVAPESAYLTANNELANKLSRLEDLVSDLRHRLTPVLQPGGDKGEACAPAVRAVPAPLVATLEHHAARADNIGDEVNDLLQRLCL